ncbi:hypothetical protein CLV58_12436 [Spirosoma oryzae]|uniref:Uncharacterized protein n=1 Tax=Spirosoma oryzae TaxID=1469603 RepID=A0A2T0SAG1_9BACT|nr:hypothetical protein CLV58_12436 [Spirosoma oryzae]
MVQLLLYEESAGFIQRRLQRGSQRIKGFVRAAYPILDRSFFLIFLLNLGEYQIGLCIASLANFVSVTTAGQMRMIQLKIGGIVVKRFVGSKMHPIDFKPAILFSQCVQQIR